MANKESTIKVKVDNIEIKYSLEDFKNKAEALGYEREVVAGALFNCKEKQISKIEFENRVKSFLGKKVE